MYPKEYINCDQEPIHICGEVQSYGFLLGTQNSRVIFYSENILDLFSLDPSILGKDIQVLFNNIGIDVNWENYSNTEDLAIQHINFRNIEYTLSIHTNGGFTF
jgi:light-regulated signal transduction histidine kinase (bacteriophytochrome)